jgi:hypothetical protein
MSEASLGDNNTALCCFVLSHMIDEIRKYFLTNLVLEKYTDSARVPVVVGKECV